MKKIIVLVTVTLALILIVFAVGYTKADKTDFVKAYRAEEKTAVEYLSYSGTLEYGGSRASAARGSGAVQSVFVKNGDKVERGDVILTVFETDKDIESGDLLSIITSGGIGLVDSLIDGGASVSVYTADSSGIVRDLELESGGLYLKGQTLFKISSEDSFQVTLSVAEKDISRVSKGQPVAIRCKALSKTIEGEITAAGDAAHQTSTQSGKLTTVKVTAMVKGDTTGLKPGYTADCSIITETKEKTLLLPYSAVASDIRGQSYVYRAQGRQLVRENVTVEKEYSNGVAISEGIEAGDIIAYNAAGVKDPKNSVVDEIITDAA